MRKYIVVIDDDIEQVVIFDDILNHSKVAKPFSKVLSAGFFSIGGNNKVTAYGESISLSLVNRGEVDAKLIEDLLFKPMC